MAGGVRPLLEATTAAAVRPPWAFAICTDNLTGFDKSNVPLCLHFLDLFPKLPLWTALAQGKVIASAVGALWFTCAITAGVAILTTRGARLPSPACILAVTNF